MFGVIYSYSTGEMNTAGTKEKNMKTKVKTVIKKRVVTKRRDVLTFDVEFTGMTEEDFEFLRNMAAEMKKAKETAKASGSAKKK